MSSERDEGQAAVELALALPLVALLLLALAQLTLVARDQLLVVHAAREGAREAAVDRAGGAVRARAAAARGSGLKDGQLEVETSHIGGGSDMVLVRVKYRSQTDLPLVGPLLPDVQMRAKAAMRSEW
jgi:Flp pilus assembly protein TadG